jgi:6,7-dimethyl-8-ribityllumazine synthase
MFQATALHRHQWAVAQQEIERSGEGKHGRIFIPPLLSPREIHSHDESRSLPVDFSFLARHTPPMSSSLPPKPRIVGPKVRICIVASKYNEQFTDALVENAIKELGELVPQGRVDLIRVPGAFEIPVMIASVLERDPPACVIALGLIIRGSTEHADLVASSVTDALQQLAVKSLRPIIHEVLLVDDEKQAYARCIGVQLNRGKEAARAAASMIDIFQELDRSMPRNASHKSHRNG